MLSSASTYQPSPNNTFNDHSIMDQDAPTTTDIPPLPVLVEEESDDDMLVDQQVQHLSSSSSSSSSSSKTIKPIITKSIPTPNQKSLDSAFPYNLDVPLILTPSKLTHPKPSHLNFYATLLGSVVLSLWANQPLPTNSAQFVHCASLPLIALLKHLLITTKLPLEQYYLALKFVQILVTSYPELTKVSKPGSEIRVTIAAIILSNKLMEDNYISKRSWARVSSFSLQELNRMELEILDGLHWSLEITVSEYDAWISWIRDLRKYWRKIFSPNVGNNSSSSSNGHVTPQAPTPSPPTTPLPSSSKSSTSPYTFSASSSTNVKQDSAISLTSPNAKTSFAFPPVSTDRRMRTSPYSGNPVASQTTNDSATRFRVGRSRALSDSTNRSIISDHSKTTLPRSNPNHAETSYTQQPKLSISTNQLSGPTTRKVPASATGASHVEESRMQRLRSASHSTRVRPEWLLQPPSLTPTDLTPTSDALPRSGHYASALIANLSIESPIIQYPPPSLDHGGGGAPVASSRVNNIQPPQAASSMMQSHQQHGVPSSIRQQHTVGLSTNDISSRLAKVASSTAYGPSSIPVSHMAMAAVVPIALPPPRPTASTGHHCVASFNSSRSPSDQALMHLPIVKEYIGRNNVDDSVPPQQAYNQYLNNTYEQQQQQQQNVNTMEYQYEY